MRKNLLTTVFAAILLVFVGCSSDSSSSSCNLAALEAAFDKAAEKYETSKDPADCKAADKIITDALNSKCIDKATADEYGSRIDCYTGGGGNNGGGDNTGGGDCATLKSAAQAALAAYNSNPSDANCHTAAQAIVAAWDADCLTDAEAMQMGGNLPCASQYL
jgi:hypothetical protein